MSQEEEEIAPMTKKEIDLIDDFKYKLCSNNIEHECSVCYVVFKDNENVKILSCMHYFHKHCLEDWLGRKGICPYCNFIVVEEILTTWKLGNLNKINDLQ